MAKATDLGDFMDFMEDDGFESPPMPSRAHPEGKVYRVPSPDAKVGLRLSALADLTLKMNRKQDVSEADIARLRLDDQEEIEFTEQVLSPELVAQMLADGVKWEHMKRLTMYAFTYFGVSKEAAENAAKNGAFSGKAVAPNRAARRSSGAKSAKSQGSGGSKKAKPKN